MRNVAKHYGHKKRLMVDMQEQLSLERTKLDENITSIDKKLIEIERKAQAFKGQRDKLA